MFTGIIQALGKVSQLEPRSDGARLRIDCPSLEPATWNEGDSIAVAGCCLTALEIDDQGFSADLSGETLEKTSLGHLKAGSEVNLEPALAMGDRLGGHWVTGHV
ncbi:MAG: riboflavin synthase, partial [Pseudomonadota bacterium]